ncbi:DUF2514 family protein [Serratia microhaemolytica]|uniref:DUF2514 family protein n=1 Tax=Serratia microhaemolytica TaxID=2675110 RepID=UPI000FDCF84D|nr:DUF2514 family protein [Serratia microhaemolytica]
MILLLLKSHWRSLAVALLIGALFGTGYLMGAKQRETAWQLKWSQRDEADAIALGQRLAETRLEEQRRQGEIDAIRQQVNQQIAAVQTDADSARATARGLHQRAAQLAERLAESERTCNTHIASGGTAKPSGSILLAELFSRADERAGELARTADEARARGLACEAAYNAIKSGEKK